MTSRELIRWSRLHEQRAEGARPLLFALALGAAFAGFVYWRQTASVVGPVAASHAWLGVTLAAFAFAFLRVPFLMYWRADASLLAQLPIEGDALFDAALWRCILSARTITAIAILATGPLFAVDAEFGARHAALAATLGLGAAFLLPAVVIWSASLVASGDSDTAARTVGIATALASGKPSTAFRAAPVPSSATLGAVPGFAATAIIVPILIISPWLTGGATRAEPALVLGIIAAASIGGIALVRATSSKIMATILRDVSALDRQRLATLEIRPITPIERAIGKLLGDAQLAYDKTARLVRRRYPMAFALGALAFLVLVIIGLARPADPVPWLAATFATAAAYAVTLATRLDKPPIELPRLAATLPIPPAARRRARHAWLAGWLLIFVIAPGAFAVLRSI